MFNCREDDHGETNKKVPTDSRDFTIVIVMINPFYPVMGLPPHFL